MIPKRRNPLERLLPAGRRSWLAAFAIVLSPAIAAVPVRAEPQVTNLPHALVHAGDGALKSLPTLAQADGQLSPTFSDDAGSSAVAQDPLSTALAPHVAPARLSTGDRDASNFPGVPALPSAGVSLASDGRRLIEVAGRSLNVFDPAGASVLGHAADTAALFGDAAERVLTGRARTLFDLDSNAFIAADTTSDGAIVIATIRDDTELAFKRYRIGADTLGSLPGCPCRADPVQIGADQNGFYFTTRLRSVESGQVAGAAIFAVGKGRLQDSGRAAGLPLTRILIPGAGALAPTATAPQAAHVAANGGTEYLLEAHGTTGFKLNLYAIANTQSLNATSPGLRVSTTELRSQVYVAPPGAESSAIDAPVVLSQGQLWAVLPTGLIDRQGHFATGVAWFIIAPGMAPTKPRITAQGYLAAPDPGTSLYGPAIAMNAAGRGAIGFTMGGPGHTRRAAFAPLSRDSRPGAIALSGADPASSAPDGSRDGRGSWPGAGTVDPADGSLWFAHAMSGTEAGAPAPTSVTHIAP